MPVWAVPVLEKGLEHMIEHRRECKHSCPHTFGVETVYDVVTAKHEIKFVKRLIEAQANNA